MTLMQNLGINLKGLLCVFLLTSNAIIWATLVLLGTLTCHLIPIRQARINAITIVAKLLNIWTSWNHLILKISLGKKLDIKGNAELDAKRWYLVISNHQTWLDIPMICIALNRKVPLLKFFMKKELLWSLPIAGLTCYLLGFPMMKRHTRSEIRKNPKLKNKDIETTHKACKKFLEAPCSVINFAEGTRYTEAKSLEKNSPYQHLLKPKAAGCAIVTNELKPKLSGIINITINYNAESCTLWHILCGRVQNVQLRYELIPISKELLGDYYHDREFRSRFQSWINELWDKKDKLIGTLKDNVTDNQNCNAKKSTSA